VWCNTAKANLPCDQNATTTANLRSLTPELQRSQWVSSLKPGHFLFSVAAF
jgi:hypothetical protein